jgi:hypothetical protein
MDILYTVKDDKKEKWQSMEIEVMIPSVKPTHVDFSHSDNFNGYDGEIFVFYTSTECNLEELIKDFKKDLSKHYNKHVSTFNFIRVDEFKQKL